MANNERGDDRSNTSITSAPRTGPDRDRRSFLKLVGATAAATGLGSSAVSTGLAASNDPFSYVESAVLEGGYPRTVAESDATAVAGTRDEFLAAVGDASSGDVVFLPGDAEIDLSGEEVAIPGGVTVASNRGVNGSDGGMLYTDVKDLPLLRTGGEGVRLTGLRLRGNHPEGYHEFTEWDESANGFEAAHADAEVDNCEIFGWGYAGVTAKADGLHVHHCDVHANEEDGLGYGVHCLGGHTTIEFNRFLHNRHAIAGGGSDPGYTARFNLVGPEGEDHAFDMHEPGGNRIVIHHNKFEYSETIHGDPIEAVKIRGVPNDVCEVTDNWFHHDSKPGDAPVSEDGEAINQSGSDGEWQDLEFNSNYYGPDASPDYGSALLEDEDPFSDSTTSSEGSSHAESNPTPSTFEVRTADDAGEVTYEFTADGEVAQGADDVENNDAVTGNGDGTWTASGSTGNGYGDVYQVSGDVVSFDATPPEVVTLVLDGTDVTDDLLGADGGDETEMTNVIRLEAGDPRTASTYSFEVSEAVEPAPDHPLDVADEISGTVVEGRLVDGADVYHYAGDVVSFDFDGSITVSVDELE